MATEELTSLHTDLPAIPMTVWVASANVTWADVVRAAGRQARVEVVGSILLVEPLPHSLTVAILESLQLVSAHSSQARCFPGALMTSLPTPTSTVQKASRNPGVELKHWCF